MFVSLILSLLSGSSRFSWSPALDLEDHAIRSALIPGAQY
jgi:hypothetical protein